MYLRKVTSNQCSVISKKAALLRKLITSPLITDGWLWLPVLLLLLAGCASPQRPIGQRSFVFHQDTFAYANELVWRYDFDPVSGKTTHIRQSPKPDYTHHCFVVTRAARQFFDNARFDPAAPAPDASTSRELVRRVMAHSPRHPLPTDQRIVIPGYSNLFEFSRAHEGLLKAECGGAWQSYFQRGHWRMIFPISSAHQQSMAEQLASKIKLKVPTLVHVVRFPQLSINHSMLLFACKETASGLEFSAYDPNDPEQPLPITYHRAERYFSMPRTRYFAGGMVKVYEI
jgi:hypothetical protein